jgi:hypothetical protein
MYIKNRRNRIKIKGFSSYQTLCLTESEVLRNRLLFNILTVSDQQKKESSTLSKDHRISYRQLIDSKVC